MTAPTEGRMTTEAKGKYPRRKVDEWQSIGLGMFRYKFSCGHSAERVGVTLPGLAIEKPHKTATCYDCPRSTGAKTP